MNGGESLLYVSAHFTSINDPLYKRFSSIKNADVRRDVAWWAVQYEKEYKIALRVALLYVLDYRKFHHGWMPPTPSDIKRDGLAIPTFSVDTV